MDPARLATLLLRATWMLLGITIGAVFVLLFQSRSEAMLGWSLWMGVAIGVGLSLFSLFAWLLLRPRDTETPTAPAPEPGEMREAMISALTGLGLPRDKAVRLWQATRNRAGHLSVLGLRLWSGTAALGLALTVTGAVIAMITAIAAIRQVDRIDSQNALIATQIEESRASRAAGIFAAQLPSLLEALDVERAAVMASRTGRPADAPQLWIPSAALVARIQAVIDSLERYRRVDWIDRSVGALNARLAEREDTEIRPLPDYRFSPERGQLLRLLIATGIDLTAMDPPLDFSGADFTGIALQTTYEDKIDLGRTRLHRANFLGVDLVSVDMSRAGLNGAVFSSLDQLTQTETWPGKGDASSRLSRRGDAAVPDRFLDALILEEPFPENARASGWLGNAGIGESKDWPWRGRVTLSDRFQQGAMSFTFGRDVDNLAAYSNILVAARVENREVIRLGRATPLLAAAGLTNALNDPFMEFSTCEELPSDGLDALRDLIWFSGQPGVHPKWQGAADHAVSQIPREHAACLDDADQAARTPPDFIADFLPGGALGE